MKLNIVHIKHKICEFFVLLQRFSKEGKKMPIVKKC